MFSRLRLAFRIARREALRYKGRSALSIALLGIPLLGVSLAATAYDTMVLSDVETTEQRIGEADAFVRFDNEGVPIVQHTWHDRWPWTEPAGPGGEWQGEEVPESEVLAALPSGSTIAPYSVDGVGSGIRVETPDGIGGIQAAGYDLSDPMYESAGLEYLEGEAPRGEQIVISKAAADHLDVGVGDTITTVDDPAEYEVSGIVELPWALNERYAVGAVFEQGAGGWLVDTPETFTYEDALALNELGMSVWSTPLAADPPSEPPVNISMGDSFAMMIYGLIVTVIVVEVVLLAGPAFAISARRRSREFALMSAAGAAPHHVRNTVLAGGLLFGVIAAVIAVTVGILAVWAAIPLMEGLFGHRSSGLQVMPVMQASMAGFAIATGLLSALAAAISASRINVVAALAGRTPQRRTGKRWPIIGLVTVAGSMAAGFTGVTLWSMPLMAAAVIGLQLGLVACTPMLVSLVAKLGRRLPLAPRMALREAGRNRGSTSPAIAAIMGVVAAGVAMSLTVTADNLRHQANNVHELPQGALSLRIGSPESVEDTTDFDQAYEKAAQSLSRHLDDLETRPVTVFSSPSCGDWTDGAPPEGCLLSYELVRPEEHRCSYWLMDREGEEAEAAAVEAARGDPRCDETPHTFGAYSDTPGSTDPVVTAAYSELDGGALDEAVALLESGGILISDEWALTEEGTALIRLNYATEEQEGSRQETRELPAMVVDEGLLGFNQMFLGPAAAAELGLEESQLSRLYLLESSTEATGAVQEAIAAEFEQAGGGDYWVSFEVTDYTNPFSFYVMLVIAILCGVIALGATAVSTGLIIAESKGDMTTLGAVGAEPKVRKRFAMWQTVVIAWLGAGLGTVAGLVGYALIREAMNRNLKHVYPFEVLYGWELPWVNFGVSLLAVPLIAAIGALVFTRGRLPSERRVT